MFNTVNRVFLVIALVPLFSTVLAHHSFTGEFDVQRLETVKGTVTEFYFVNPHIRIYLDVENEQGETEEWWIEMNSRSNMTRNGWTQDSVPIGQEIVVTANPARNGSNAMGLLGDGTLLNSDTMEPVVPGSFDGQRQQQ